MSKKNLISIDFSPKFFYIVVFLIFSLFEQILWTKANKKLNFVVEENEDSFEKLSKKEKHSRILILTTLSLMKSIDLIIYYFVKIKFNKKTKTKTVISQKDLVNLSGLIIMKKDIKKDKNVEKNIKHAYVIIVICEFIFYLLSLLRFFTGYTLYYNKNLINIFVNLNTFIFPLILGYFLFNERIYNHHKLVLILILIADIMILISDPIFDKNETFFLRIGHNFYLFYIKAILFNFLIVKIFLEKYIMHFYYLNQYLIVGYEGLVGIFFSILIILFEIIFSEGKYLKNFAKELFSNFYFYLLIFNSYILINLEITINYYFNPAYVILANYYFLIEDFYKLLAGKYKNEKIYCNFLFIIKDILTLIAVLIFSEIIIINRFSLERYTKKEIEKRAINDSTKSLDEITQK